MATATERDIIAGYNERTKLTAQAVQNTGLGALGFAVIQPAVTGTVAMGWRSAIATMVGLAMLALARYIVGKVIRERTP